MAFWGQRHRGAASPNDTTTTPPRPSKLEDLSWKDVTRLVADVYHRRGYSVIPTNDDNVPVDFILQRGDEKVFLQCRRWNVWEVADRAVHELVGYAAGAGAGWALILTTGRFTDSAQAFARPRNLELVDGAALREYLAD